MSRASSWGRWLLAATGLVGATLLAAAHPAAASDAVPRQQRVMVFADSVGLGARTAIPNAFPPGWSVHVDGQPARFVEQMVSQYVLPDLAAHPDWFGDHVVVAAGYNAPYWDWERFDRSIDAMVDTLTEAGVKHVYWVTLREVTTANSPAAGRSQIDLYGFYFPIVNAHLEAALDRHPNLTLIDWRAVSDQVGLTYDAIHLNTAGAARYSTLVADTVLATRTTVPDRAVAPVAVPAPDGAGAAIVNLTTTAPRRPGFLTVDAGSDGCAAADVSVHNFRREQVAAHAAIVPVADDGSFCVGTSAASNLIADVSGTFPVGAGFQPIAAQRWADTRRSGIPLAAGASLTLDLAALGLPAGTPWAEVAGVALTVTATGATAPGWLAVGPCGTGPSTSNVNYLDGFPVPNLVVAGTDPTGRVCVTTLTSTHVVVDAFGVFTGEAGLRAAPRRAFDSRTAGGPVAAGSVTRIEVPGDDVGGVVLNLTAVGARAPGYVTAYPCSAGLPNASNLAVPGPAPVSNATIVAPDDDHAVCVYSLRETDLIVDIQATIGDAFVGRTPERVLDTRS